METLGDPKGGVLDGNVPLEAFRQSAIAHKAPLEEELPKPDPYSEERVAGRNYYRATPHGQTRTRTRSLAIGWGLGMVIAAAFGAVVISGARTSR